MTNTEAQDRAANCKYRTAKGKLHLLARLNDDS